MKRCKVLFLIPALFFLPACHSRNRQADEIPLLGYYANRADAQSFANRATADLAKLRAEEKADGVPRNELPCGHYVVTTTKDADGHIWWGVRLDKTGCPATRTLPNPLALPEKGDEKQ